MDLNNDFLSFLPLAYEAVCSDILRHQERKNSICKLRVVPPMCVKGKIIKQLLGASWLRYSCSTVWFKSFAGQGKLMYR